MSETDPEVLATELGWKHLEQTLNADYYVAEPGVLVIVPPKGATDTLESASRNIDVHDRYARAHGSKVGLVIFFDRLVNQDKDARRTYNQRVGDSCACVALVGGTMLSRAMGSFFMGLAKTPLPIKMFPEYGRALEWVRERQRDAVPPTKGPA